MANQPGGGLQNLARTLCHRPYQGDDWQLYVFLLAIGQDACLEKLNQGVHDRLVFDAVPSALPYIAADRGNILRGLTEADDSFRQRLSTAFDDLKIAGSAWSILRQVLGYVLTCTPRAFTVSSTWLLNVCKSSTWDLYADGQATTAAPTHSKYNTAGLGNWDWDSLSPTDGSWGWWRWYLGIDYRDLAGQQWIGPAPKLGSAGHKMGECPYAMGVDTPAAVGKSVFLIVHQWMSNWCQWIIICFDGALFDPDQSAGGGINPDGHFGHWSKLVGGVFVRARFADARYFEGPI